MWKIFWPNGESLFPTKHPALVPEIRTRLCQTSEEGNRIDSVILCIWTKLFVRINGKQQYLIFGVSWIRTGRAVDQDGVASIFYCNLTAISMQPSDSLVDCCAVKARNRCGSSPAS